MAIGTPVVIATETNIGDPSTVTTTEAVPSGALVILMTGYAYSSDTRILSSVSGGGLTWAIDHHQTYDGTIFWYFDIASAQAPSGVADSTVITMDWTGQVFVDMTTVAYCEGLETSSVKDVSDGNGETVSGNWDTTATNTTVTDTLVIGGCISNGLETNTATGGATELSDFQYVPDTFSVCCEYKILSAAGSASLTGTWTGGSSDKTSAFVAYKGPEPPPPDTGLAWIRA